MREFFTCGGTTYDHGDAEIKQDAITPLENKATGLIDGVDFTPSIFIRLTETRLQPLLNAFRMKKEKCELDVDGKTLRPPCSITGT